MRGSSASATGPSRNGISNVPVANPSRGDAPITKGAFGCAARKSAAGNESLMNSGKSMFGIRPVRAMSDDGGLTLTEPGVSVELSTVEPVETRELRDPRLIAT